MTEAEAKTKWCPFARAVYNDLIGGSINRSSGGGAPDGDCMCMASGCMAWRVLTPLAPDDGYCGMAGQPVRFAIRQSSEC